MISRNLKIIFISGLLICIMLTIPVQADEVDIFTYDGEEETASEEAYELRMDYYEELEMAMEDMREQYRKLEDISEMAEQQDRAMLMKIAQKEKENYNYLKQIVEK